MPTECFITEHFYQNSPKHEFEFKGHREYYMEMAGFVQLIANLGMIVESTYQSTKLQDQNAWM